MAKIYSIPRKISEEIPRSSADAVVAKRRKRGKSANKKEFTEREGNWMKLSLSSVKCVHPLSKFSLPHQVT